MAIASILQVTGLHLKPELHLHRLDDCRPPPWRGSLGNFGYCNPELLLIDETHVAGDRSHEDRLNGCFRALKCDQWRTDERSLSGALQDVGRHDFFEGAPHQGASSAGPH